MSFTLEEIALEILKLSLTESKADQNKPAELYARILKEVRAAYNDGTKQSSYEDD